MILLGLFITFAENESRFRICFNSVLINFLEETFVFGKKLTLQNFNVLWPKTCQIFFGKFSACLSKSLSTCLEGVSEEEVFCIFLFYISVQFFEQVFWGFCPKNLDIFVKTAFQDFDGRMFLRKLHSSNYFRNFDGILSSGLSRLHFTLLHENFMGNFFSKNFNNFQNFSRFRSKGFQVLCECFFAGMSKQHFACREDFAEEIYI